MEREERLVEFKEKHSQLFDRETFCCGRAGPLSVSVRCLLTMKNSVASRPLKCFFSAKAAAEVQLRCYLVVDDCVVHFFFITPSCQFSLTYLFPSSSS